MDNLQHQKSEEPDRIFESSLKKQCPLCSSLNVSFQYVNTKTLASYAAHLTYGWALFCQDEDCRGFCVIPGSKEDPKTKYKAEIAFAMRNPPKGEEWGDYEQN